jgi:uroporphyrinogen-III decarboxylase
MAHDQLTSKERVCRALAGEPVDVLPAVPAYLSLFLEDFERAYYVEQYRRRLHRRSRYAIDHEEDTRFRAEALYQSYGIFKVKPDWIEVHQGASRAWAKQTCIVAEGGVLCYEDRSSGVRLPMHQASLPRGDRRLAAQSTSLTDLWDLSSQIRTEADVDARLPIVSAEELLMRGDYDLPKLVVSEYGEDFYISTILDTPFSDAYDLLGFQGLMTIQYDQPALFHHLLERKRIQSQEVMGAWAGVGVHGVYVEEVFTGADMISAQSYDEFVFAYNQPYFHHMCALGLLPIHYVCGDALPRLDRMADLEVAAVAVEESKKSFSAEIEQVVDRVQGRVAVLGNVDTIRFGLHGTMEQMTSEVRRQAQVGSQAKGFLVSTGSPFPLDTNPRLLDTLVATAHAIEG